MRYWNNNSVKFKSPLVMEEARGGCRGQGMRNELRHKESMYMSDRGAEEWCLKEMDATNNSSNEDNP